jgi:NTE family protein
MSDAALHTLPDVLVCGVGGTLGEAWLRGLLAGAADEAGIDWRDCPSFVGTSAGSIMASTLAAGRPPSAGDGAARAWARAQEAPAPPDPGPGVAGRTARTVARRTVAAGAPAVPLLLAAAAPGRRVARAAALAAAPDGLRSIEKLARWIDELGARFDGRLRIVAVERRSGRRVVFGAPKAYETSVGRAVIASCAVPAVFAPVRIGDREYVDGGMWSPTNLDIVPVQQGQRVLCLAPTAGSVLLGRVTRAAIAVERLALRARGAELSVVVPDHASLLAMGRNLMDDSRRGRVVEAAYAQGRRHTVDVHRSHP